MLTTADGKRAEGLFGQLLVIIVIDLRMAWADELDVLFAANQAVPETPLIILTGHSTVASAVEAIQQGAFAFLTQLADPAELLLVIQQAAQRSQLQREVRRLRRQLAERGALTDPPLDIQGSKARTPMPRFRAGLTLAELEREAIQQGLIQTGGSRQRTAELLGISTRTLLRKIREYRLEDPLRPNTPTPVATSPAEIGQR